MPHSTEAGQLDIIQLHPTFGAEIRGVDFSNDLPEAVFAQILAAITKVCQNKI